jgi:hypothetical protein
VTMSMLQISLNKFYIEFALSNFFFTLFGTLKQVL